MTTILDAARNTVLTNRSASVAMLQRTLALGFAQAQELLSQLQAEGLVTPTNPAGFRVVDTARFEPVLMPAGVTERWVRSLRDLALYLVECQEAGQGAHSDAVREILSPRELPLPDAREALATSAAASEPSARVLAVARALAAKLPPPHQGDLARLETTCAAAAEQLLIDREMDPARRGYLQLMRYLQKRILDGFDPHSRAIEWYVPAAAVARGRAAPAPFAPHPEHVVPCAALQREAMALLRVGVPPEDAVNWIRPRLVVIDIERRAAAQLDGPMQLRYTMPSDWSFATGCTYERLHLAGVAFEQPAGAPQCTCSGSHAVDHPVQ